MTDFKLVEDHEIGLVNPIMANTGKLIARSVLIQAGQGIATAEARLTDSTGKLLAFGATTCAILDLKAEN